MVYRYRLIGYDAESKNTNDRRVEYQNLRRGSYTFEVLAVDRDLVYSESPATVKLKIVPPFYLRAGFLVPMVGGGSILIALLIILSLGYIKHRRESQAYEKEIRSYEKAALQELQEANQVQMLLMPDTAPPVEGVEIAGKCLPANTVSGDFFDYLAGKNNEVVLVVADVCGKAMKGAMNAVMVDGVLQMAAEEMERLSPASLLMKLNNVLKARMERDMNVTMVIGKIDASTKTLTLANAGHHAHPLLLCNGDVQHLKARGMPLGMMKGIEYSQEDFQLQSDDILIFMTDGIIEAQDSDEQLYSDSGRLEETIS
jgi:serine phosphatase RsbU (regulator of sigma subunit)